MNYRKVYVAIINKAKLEQNKGLRPKSPYKYRKLRKNDSSIYFEFHHILPRSLFPRWANKKTNIVPLTLREHFFCHKLLSKIYNGPEMAYALWLLSQLPNHKEVVSSREYEKIRMLIWNYQARFGPKNGFFQKTHTEENKRKNAEWHHTHKYSKEVYDKIHEKNRGSHRTPEQRKRQSEAALKRDNSKNIARIKKVKVLYDKYKLENGKLLWNEFQKKYKEYEIYGNIKSD